MPTGVPESGTPVLFSAANPSRLCEFSNAGEAHRRGAFGNGTFAYRASLFTHMDGKEANMNFIIWIVVGGILGWLASIVMRTDAQQGMFLNVVVGIIGALLGGWLLAPLFGTGTINQSDFSIPALLVSFLGAIVLLAIVNLVRRGTPR
jgi:uncharacterized membrane protein YeaQ/YmgE (transglycosylase-associated protein family)